MVQTVQLKRTSTPNQAPPSLQPGELAIEMASAPPRLWVGVPTSVDAAGMKLLLPSGIAVSETPPPAPVQGTFWYESDTGTLWMWYDDGSSQQWVQVNGVSSPGGGSGGSSSLDVSGTTMLFYMGTAPVGWTKVTTADDAGLRLVSGTSGGAIVTGTLKFSDVVNRTATDEHLLVINEMPAHFHNLDPGDSHSLKVPGTGASGDGGNWVGGLGVNSTAYEGSAAPHMHGINLNMTYVDVIAASKD